MNKVYFLGDVHGEILPIKLTLKLIKEYDYTDTLVLLGDVGANYYLNKKDKKFKEELNNVGITLFCIRGNHEARPVTLWSQGKSQWHTETYFGGVVIVEDKYPHIKYATDYASTYIINGYKTLVMPGAYSVDKEYRLMHGYKWFYNEQMNSNEKEKCLALAKELKEVDIILSHTCPLSMIPEKAFIKGINQDKVDKSMEIFFEEIKNILDYKIWLCGHYHITCNYLNGIIPSFLNPRQIILYNNYALDLDEIFKKELEFI